MTVMPPLELTLVLAATREMGIGRNGALPWTGLKKEMAYFARVTKRLPSNVNPSPNLVAFTFLSFSPLLLTRLATSTGPQRRHHGPENMG
jgi:hypothetical protein